MASSSPTPGKRDLAQIAECLRAAVSGTFLGHELLVEHLLASTLARGHVLLEGVPGLGKTLLARSFASACGLGYTRLQCTPDLLPGDITGSELLQQDADGRRALCFEPGPVFTNILLADEVNRATPRTQSALLEAMQDREVSVGGTTRELPSPFLVIATQNPIELEGTYPLPEAQLDRFLLKLVLRPPQADALRSILEVGASPSPPEVVVEPEELAAAMEQAESHPVAPALVEQVANLIASSWPDSPSAPAAVREHVRAGASPRAGLALLSASRALSAIRGHTHTIPSDLVELVRPALGHRLLLHYRAEASGVGVDEVLEALLAENPIR